MLAAFLHFIEEKKLIAAGEKTLVAASAGVDSTVLCHLFRQAGLLFEMAHCNFRLRGDASDRDELFVKELAGGLGVRFHSVGFDTLEHAAAQRLSVQVAARQLRYEWLEKTRTETGCHLIATAHHLDDSIETVLYNFTKGCGIRGLHGILPVQGSIVRPLLFATKEQVLDFAKQENLAYREDESNRTVKYARNKIRNEVVPVLAQINPAFQRTAGQTIERLRDAEALYDYALNKLKADLQEIREDELLISMDKLRNTPAPATVLFELLSPFGFNGDQVAQIMAALDGQPGKLFISPEYRLLVDRSSLVVTPEKMEGQIIQINDTAESPIRLPNGCLRLEQKPGRPVFFEKNDDTAWLDLDKLRFPLVLRPWLPGDVFQPLGMGGKHRKLQDLFSDGKLTRFQKENVRVLESGGEIAWVVGMRLDERFKVSDLTERCLVATFEPDNFANQ